MVGEGREVPGEEAAEVQRSGRSGEGDHHAGQQLKMCHHPSLSGQQAPGGYNHRVNNIKFKTTIYKQNAVYGHKKQLVYHKYLTVSIKCSIIPITLHITYIGTRLLLIKSFVSIQSHASMLGKDVSSYQKCDNSCWLSFDIHTPIFIVDVRLGRRRVCLM